MTQGREHEIPYWGRRVDPIDGIQGTTWVFVGESGACPVCAAMDADGRADGGAHGRQAEHRTPRSRRTTASQRKARKQRNRLRRK